MTLTLILTLTSKGGLIGVEGGGGGGGLLSEHDDNVVAAGGVVKDKGKVR